MSRRKGISFQSIILLLTVIFLIIIGMAYYLRVTNEKSIFGRLGIIPIRETDITTTTVLINCDNDLDCQEQTKCESRMLFYRTGGCGSDKKCSYGNWTFKDCIQSIQYCGAECDGPEDCAIDCDPNSCICI